MSVPLTDFRAELTALNHHKYLALFTVRGRTYLTEVALFNEAFSLSEPKKGASRLRLACDDGGKTYENLHRCAPAFADGQYTAIRNPGMHKPQ
ncbi:hypothetical protein [Saccharomonospora piscinae]|uniref:hypothetical protein n=1 Tax=Saccharomonospora piscinae TaxID=687388 RepID=UPI000466C063|nr:hypothetical protein [Saccharomonospora piscinae]